MTDAVDLAGGVDAGIGLEGCSAEVGFTLRHDVSLGSSGVILRGFRAFRLGNGGGFRLCRIEMVAAGLARVRIGSHGPVGPLTHTDRQPRSVVVEITPVDLTTSGDTLVFDVSLNTHSVDLSMDLAAEATLTTDTGNSVNALAWQAPRAGHHVSGTLTFPRAPMVGAYSQEARS